MNGSRLLPEEGMSDQELGKEYLHNGEEYILKDSRVGDFVMDSDFRFAIDDRLSVRSKGGVSLKSGSECPFFGLCRS